MLSYENNSLVISFGTKRRKRGQKRSGRNEIGQVCFGWVRLVFFRGDWTGGKHKEKEERTKMKYYHATCSVCTCHTDNGSSGKRLPWSPNRIRLTIIVFSRLSVLTCKHQNAKNYDDLFFVLFSYTIFLHLCKMYFFSSTQYAIYKSIY